MPIATLYTNLSADAAKLDASFRTGFIVMLAETLQKPQGGVALVVQAGEHICQIGMDAEAGVVILNVKAIGHLSAEENVRHARTITDFLCGHFHGQLEPGRVLIHFENLEKHEVARNGTTVQQMLAGGNAGGKA